MLVAPRPSTRAATLPAPTGGIDTVANIASMDPSRCLVANNMTPSATGMVVRPGYAEWANGAASGGSFTTLIPFTGSADDGSDDKLWAANTDGLYNITTSTTSPTADHSWGTTGSTAGRCSFAQFNTDNNDHVLLVADEENGLISYDETTGLWTTPVVTGVTAADIVFVQVWKNHVWAIERDSTSAWYSAAGAFAGAYTQFNLGALFKHGGNLRGVFNWTLDSGQGPDDYLVAVSGGGDVVVWQGSDPTDATKFGIVGTYYIGDMPFGRRVGSLYGGDLLLLSSKGLISMTALVRGVDPFSLEASASWRIQGYLDALMAEHRDEFGWEIQLHPSQSKLVISTPKVSNDNYIQLVYDVNTKGWCVWESCPIGTSASWGGQVYIAGNTDNVHKLTGSIDNVLLVDTDTFVPGDVTAGTDRIALTAHPFANSDPVRVTTDDTLPAPLLPTQDYYVKVIDANTIELYQEASLATIVDLTDGGVGNHTITEQRTQSRSIEWRLLTAFSGLESPEAQKRVQFLRPVFISEQTPSYQIEPKYNYDISAAPVPSSASEIGAAIWDTSAWDNAVFGGTARVHPVPRGGHGLGTKVAVALRGKSSAKTTLINIGVFWDTGGLL